MLFHFEVSTLEIKKMAYYSIMNLGVFMLVGFPNTYLYFLLQNELNFTLNQDFFRYLIISIGMIIGIFSGPLFGYLSDRTHSKLGRRRIWIIIFAPLTAIFFWLIAVPVFRENIIQSAMLFPYIIVIYSIYSAFYNAMNIPYIGLMADITPEDYCEFLTGCLTPDNWDRRRMISRIFSLIWIFKTLS